MERRQGKNWTDTQIEHLAETGLSGAQVAMATRYMTLQKLLNRIEKYAGCEYGTGCYSASERIRHTAITYADYLSMRVNAGYDLSNSVYQKPRDLEAAHNKLVMESNKAKMDRHLEEVAERYPEIRKSYKNSEINIITKTIDISSDRLDQQRKLSWKGVFFIIVWEETPTWENTTQGRHTY